MSAVTTAKLAARPAASVVIRDYIALTKPRVVSLLLVTALAGMLVAQQGWPTNELVLAVLVGGALAAGGANAINMWFDRDIDAEMYRTRELVVYTMWLKRSTTQNIVIGGAAGAFPPVIGYAAVTGNLDLTALYMFMIVFFWTPPHFWALALRLNADYDRAQVPMLQVVRGRKETQWQVLLYTLVLLAITLLMGLRGFGTTYMVAVLALGTIFVTLAVMMMRDSGTRWARRTYKYSLAYLALVFAAMVGDALLRGAAVIR